MSVKMRDVGAEDIVNFKVGMRVFRNINLTRSGGMGERIKIFAREQHQNQAREQEPSQFAPRESGIMTGDGEMI